MTGARTWNGTADVGVFEEVDVGGTIRGGSINDINGVQTGSFTAGGTGGGFGVSSDSMGGIGKKP